MIHFTDLRRTILLVLETGLPGADLVARGIEDLEEGRESVASLLVAIGRPRLSRLGLSIPLPSLHSPEHRLYELLAERDGASAHSRYNAWLRRLISFERAAERANIDPALFRAAVAEAASQSPHS